ncbi:MAG: right-handed parallel beta-helix repeat-containing protein, partial [Candidatus Omnitrophica bacterium]|nr:right-handed parallel beta-helix repeat-containing protein [Candidatus Omnitrophota bacterium]
NIASTRGGGISGYQSNLSIYECAFHDNQGGGIYLLESNADVSHCRFIGNSATWGGGLYGEESTVEVFGGDFRKNQGYVGGAIGIKQGQIRISGNCEIEGNSASDRGGGVYFYRLEAPGSIVKCTFINNSSARFGGGLAFSRSSPEIVNCVIGGNSSPFGSAVYCEDKSSPKLNHCTIAENRIRENGGAVELIESSSPIILNSILWNIGPEIWGAPATVSNSCVQGGFRGTGNFSKVPMFVDADQMDFHLQNGSPCLDRIFSVDTPVEDIEGNQRPGVDGLADLGAHESPDDFFPLDGSVSPKRFYVSSEAPDGGDGLSWGSACNSIARSLLNPTTGGVQIWVRKGTYHEAIVLEPGVQLYGGFEGSEEAITDRVLGDSRTVIDASGQANGAHVVIAADQTRLDQLTLTGGNAQNGGGILFVPGAVSHVLDCEIIGNKAHSGGGVYGDSASLTFRRCTFSDNTATSYGGAIAHSYSNIHFLDCLFENNSSEYGGGISSKFSTELIARCVLRGNHSGFRGGAIEFLRSDTTLAQCLFTDNYSNQGGAVYLDTTTAYYPLKLFIVNCTFFLNAGILEAGAIYSKGENYPYVRNCIIWNNPPRETKITTTRYLVEEIVQYSTIKGGLTGTGNTDANPWFVDPINRDLRLRPDSPCIDAGDPGSSNLLPISALAFGDHEGRVRIWDGDNDGVAVADRGAFESGSPPFVGDLNSDAAVNSLDLFVAQGQWDKTTGAAPLLGDQNGDNRFDAVDLQILKHAWGSEYKN